MHPDYGSQRPRSDVGNHAQVLWVDPYRGLKTLRHDLTLDRGVSFQAASRKLEHEQSAGDRFRFHAQ